MEQGSESISGSCLVTSTGWSLPRARAQRVPSPRLAWQPWFLASLRGQARESLVLVGVCQRQEPPWPSAWSPAGHLCLHLLVLSPSVSSEACLPCCPEIAGTMSSGLTHPAMSGSGLTAVFLDSAAREGSAPPVMPATSGWVSDAAVRCPGAPLTLSAAGAS